MQCPKCQNWNPDGTRYCVNCGQVLAAPSQPPRVTSVQNPPTTAAYAAPAAPAPAYATPAAAAVQSAVIPDQENPARAPLPPDAGQAAAPRLRPQSIGPMFDTAFRIYRRNFGKFLSACAMVVVPIYLWRLTYTFLDTYKQFNAIMDAVKILNVALTALFIFFMVLVQMAIIRMASDAVLGLPVDRKRAFNFIRPRVFQGLGVALLTVLACGAAALALVLPGIVLLVMYYFGLHTVVLENRQGVAAMRRSAFLVESFWARTFFVCLLCFGLFQFAAAVPSLALMLSKQFLDVFVLRLLEATLSQAAQLFLTPLIGIAGTVLYYDLRVVKEGLDLELACEVMWP